MPATDTNDFFREKRSFAEIKQEIFGKYFEAWCNTRAGKMKTEPSAATVFIDLHVTDGLELHEKAVLPANGKNHFYKSIIKRPALNETLHTFFYDKSKEALELVKEHIETELYYQELTHAPVAIDAAESKAQLAELLDTGSSSLVFTDPFSSSYAQQILHQAILTWRSDLFMLLTPDTINRAFAGSKAGKALTELFGEHLHKINNYSRKEKDKSRRQTFILDQFISLLNSKGYTSLLFKVNLPEQEQAEHYLLFASPDAQAYRSFKEVMLPYSTFQEDGVPEFMTNEFPQPQLSLFEQLPKYTIPNLVECITSQAGNYKYKSIEAIYELDSLGTNYTRENYVVAFELLRKAGKVEFLNPKTMQTIRQATPASVVKYKL